MFPKPYLDRCDSFMLTGIYHILMPDVGEPAILTRVRREVVETGVERGSVRTHREPRKPAEADRDARTGGLPGRSGKTRD
jgi:hypothetical protein